MSSRVLAACCLVAALAGCGGDSGNGELAAPQPGPSASPLDPSRTASLSDPDFDTSVPSGWHRRAKRRDGDRFYYLNSGPAYTIDLSIAPRGDLKSAKRSQRQS